MLIRHVIGLVLLFVAWPLQLYLMKYSQDFRYLVSGIVKNLTDDLLQLSSDYVTGCVNTTNNYLRSTYDYLGLSAKPMEEQEVPENLIRNFRPPHLEFSVGDVILTHAMIPGIIVGWNIDKTDLTKEPKYLILVEDREELMELDQDKIAVQLQYTKINHKMVNQYFESFDGIGYLPKISLKKMYPKG